MRKRFYELLLNSVTESNRFSPRLLTAFSMSATALAMLWRGITTVPCLDQGVLVTGYPPNDILLTVLGFVATLFGLGTIKQIKEGLSKSSDSSATNDNGNG